MKPNLQFKHSILERFLRYVQIDTQSDATSSTCPSTAKQWDLLKLLEKELIELGLIDVELDENGYLYATLPSNSSKNIPILCFCAHVDTSPDAPGKNVNARIFRSYQGEIIDFPKVPGLYLDPKEHVDLLSYIGFDIITTDGTTLLGADNKAGLAEIMDAMSILQSHPEIKHGEIRVLFTPDEEIGRGVDKINMDKVRADIGYTMDGGKYGEYQEETFHAKLATLVIHGKTFHPGYSKDKMESALKIGANILSNIPAIYAPEHTSKRQGFIHPVSQQGTAERMEISMILRAFEEDTLMKLENFLTDLCTNILAGYPNSSFELSVKEQYKNMKVEVEKNPKIKEMALSAIQKVGLEPINTYVRGGTDGARLSFMGLPCPNLFCGEHAIHSRIEWTCLQEMEAASEVIIHLAQNWEQNS